MYNEKIEALISAALADGKLTEKEKQVLFKKAQAEGIDLDEFEMVLDARLVELEKAEKEKAAASAPKSTKYGDVRKCPVCGAMVLALAGTCPECGYEFSGVDANLSSKQLAKLLDDIDKRKLSSDEYSHSYYDTSYAIKEAKIELKKQAILTFPIPNTKSDLFEFIAALLPKISEQGFRKAYRTKLEECILKAHSLFPNDAAFTPLMAEYESYKKKNLLKIITITTIGVLLLGGIIFICVFFPVRSAHSQDSAYLNNKAVEQVHNGKLKAAEKTLLRFKRYYFSGEKMQYGYATLIDAYLSQENISEATRIYSMYKTSCGGDVDDRLALNILGAPIRKYYYSQQNYEEGWKYIGINFEGAIAYLPLWQAYYNCYTELFDYMRENNQSNDAIKFLNKHAETFRRLDEWRGDDAYRQYNYNKSYKSLINYIKHK